MSITNLNLFENAPSIGVVSSALASIKAEGLNNVYCGLTGVKIGVISDEEITLCLQLEVNKDPMISESDLIDAFGLRHYSYSSGPAPSLRLHRDHNTLVRILRLAPNGPARLLAYLSGRLFFESLVPTREQGTSQFGQDRLAYLIELQDRIAFLASNWSQSLTAFDESALLAGSAVNILSIAGAMKPSESTEAKAAQSCLEILLRLDAIQNLRHAFYNAELKDRLIAFREADEWTFVQYRDLLIALESDGIVRLQRRAAVTRGNAASVSAALESISWSQKRMSRQVQDSLSTLSSALEKGQALGKFGVGSSGSALLALVNETLRQPSLSKKDKLNLQSVVRQLNRDVESVSQSDKRLASLQHTYAKSGMELGETLVKRGDSATKSLARAYLDRSEEVPAELKSKFESILKSERLERERLALKKGKPLTGKASKPRKPKTIQQQKLAALFVNDPASQAMIAGLKKGETN